MRTDYTSRIAAVMLAALFLSNDVLASARALQQGFIPVRRVSVVGVSSAPGLHPFDAVNVEDHTRQEATNQDQVAYMGGHPNDLHNRSEDDVFDLELDLSQAKYQYAYLSYEVKGIENPEALPKSLNGGRTYGSATLNSSPSNQWKLARVRVSMDDLVDGNNALQFSIPEEFHYPVEVRNVQIELSSDNVNLTSVQPSIARAPADAMDFEVLSDGIELQGYKVTSAEAASIPGHIVNVTRRSYAYHLDGSGNEGYHIAIGVDPSQIRSQSDLNEVQVFFFDRLSKSWKRAHVVTVDHRMLRVEAMVPGETDYFAGLIKSPEMPEARAYVPTNISDIEPANPATGMRLMQPPQVNRTGSANISYPLWIPQGRNGMTPPVALNYNSDQGTGWLGMGWNMGVSSISVDTKWGVPAFDTHVETEPYILDGEALFMEGNKRANRPTLDGNGDVVPLSRKSGTVRFFPRVMSSYIEIERKGSSPSNYYWIVTDASQTKQYYGSIDGTSQDTNSILTTSSGEVAQWYLKRVEDKWGNTIDYEYQLYEEGTSATMKSGGKNRIVKSIRYTGFDGSSYEQGKYSIEFHTSDNRADARVSMNFGLKHVDDRRLDSVSAFYNSQLLVRYKMTYKNNSSTFFKSVLTALQEYRSGQKFYEHTFDYYEDGIDYEQSVVLDANKPDPWLKSSSDVSFFEPIREGVLRVLSPSSLHTSITRGFSVGGSLGFGYTQDLKQSKNGTFSIGIGFDQNWTSATRTMRDINGDGLADLLYEDYNGDFSYSPIHYENGAFTVGGRREFGTSGVDRSTNSSFRTNIDYRSTGGYYVGLNWNTSTTKAKRALTDYNLDGVPDLIIDHGSSSPAVQFGIRDSKGDLTFSQSSEHTLNPVIKGVDFDLSQEDRIKEFQIVRTWKAPRSGEIRITGTAQVREGLNGEGAVAIQHNSTFKTESFEDVTPTTSHTSNYQFEVVKGDLILFRTISRDDGQEDFIEWNPSVQYVSGSFTDGNSTSWSSSSASDGFLLSGREGVSLKGDREFKLELNLSVNATLTDDVYLVMQPYIDGTPQDPIVDDLPVGGPYTTTNLNSYGFVGGYDSFDNVTGYSASDNVSFKFSLWSTSNVDWDKIEFRPVVKLDDDCKAANEQYPLVDYETYNEVVIIEGDQNRPSTSTTEYEVIPQITIDTADINDCFNYSSQDEDGIVYMTVKSSGNFLSRVAVHFERDYSNSANNTIKVHPMNATTGEVLDGTNLSYATFNNNANVKFLGSQIVSNRLFVEFHGTGPAAKQLAEYIDQHLLRLRFLSNGSNQTVGGTSPNKNIYYREFNEFNMHYLSWGRFAWSPGEPEQAEAAIDTADLHSVALEELEDGTIDLTDSTDIFNNRDGLNPLNHNFFAMNPTRGEVAFGLRSYHKNLGSGEDLDRYSVFGTYMGEYKALNGISSGYLGEEETDVETLPDEPGADASYKANGALSYSRSSTLGITGGYEQIATVAINFSQKDVLYSRSKRLFLDVNGDGYPDVLNENDDVVTIYRTNSFGSHTAGITNHGLSDYLGKGTSFGTAVSSGGSVTIESGMFLNLDPRFHVAIKEKKLPISGSLNLGRQRARTDFIDVNGDGLLDEYYDDVESWSSASPVFALNRGGVMEGTTFSAHDKINGSTFVVSASLASPSTVVSHWRTWLDKIMGNDPGLVKDSKSWEVGAAVNHAVNQSERIYLDLTGDGLVDYLEYDTDFFNDKVRIYINNGHQFQYYGEVSTDPIDEQINKHTGLGFSARLTGTGAFNLWGVKIKGSLTGNGDVSVNRLQNGFMDMNGDGAPDYVEHSGQGDLQVYFAKFGRTGKLKTVHNPLGGSFTVHYEAEGQKSGYYEPQIKTHLSDATNEKMIWDMPQGKLVMSSLTVNDGLDIVDGSDDLDGVDETTVRFAYDGGIHSRREREFLGFTRIATITESHIEEHTNEEHLRDYCDYDNIETPRDLSGNYSAPESAPNLSVVDTLSRYNMTVLDFSRPESLEKDELFAFNYLSRLPETQFILHAHEWVDSVEVTYCITPNPQTPGECLVSDTRWDKFFLDHIELVSESNPDYEIRLVDTDPVSPNFGEVMLDGEAWYVVQNLNELGEASTIFPAVKTVKKVSFPVVEDRDHYNASKLTFEYDKYFNVVRSEDEGTGVATTPDTVVVDTMYYTHYVYETQSNACSTIASFDTVYNDGLIYGLSIPWASAGDYEDAIVFGMFEPSACFIDSIPSDFLCEEGVNSFTTTHRGEKTDTIFIKEVNYNANYSGNLIAVMTYFAPSTSTSNQTNVLESHKVYEGSTSSSNLKRSSKVLDLEDNRSPGRIAQYLSTQTSPPSSKTAESLIRYTKYGLTDSLVGPKNLNAQRAYRTFSYDSQLHQFVTQVVNEHNDTVCSSHDPGYQHLLQSVDPNGHPMRYTYDDFQRPEYIWAPREIYNNANGPTIAFEYFPDGKDSTQTGGDVPVAFTYHNTGNQVKSVTYIPSQDYCGTPLDISSFTTTMSKRTATTTLTDGMDQPVQIQTIVDWDNPGTPAHTMTDNYRVSGITKRNKFGLSILQRNDTLISSQTLGHLAIFSSSTVSESEYDYVSRPVKQTGIWAKESVSGDELDYNEQNITYLWSTYNSTDYFTTRTNVMSVSQVHSFTDSRGQMLASKVEDLVGSLPDAVTHYTYDALGQVTQVKNPIDEITYMEYDNFGRITREVHPDRDTTWTGYDLAGNIRKVETAVTKPDSISFDYNYNRLIEKTLPAASTSGDLYNAFYTYGEKGDGLNGAGRVVQILQGDTADPVLAHDLKYSELGQVSRSEKEFAVPGEGYKDFVTESFYDSFGRVLQLIYPDGEKVDYSYSNLGKLTSISTLLSGVSGSVINTISYDGYSNVAFMEYGNGTQTTYRYHDYNRMLMESSVDADMGTGITDVLDRDYDYGNRGMITSVTRDVHSGLTASEPTSHTFDFTYDALNRLKNADFQFNVGRPTTNYSIDMSYNKAGGITTKESDVISSSAMIDTGLDYDLSYTYDSSHPHQMKTVADATNNLTSHMSYNAVGSLEEVEVQDVSLVVQSREKYRWNEEQMLVADSNDQGIHHYIYDYTGERIMKSSFTSSTIWTNDTVIDVQNQVSPYKLYVNPYLVESYFSNANQQTKHYYMGMTRIMTDISLSEVLEPQGGGSSSSTKQEQGSNESQPERAFNDPVFEDLKTQLEAFGLVENVDYLETELKEPLSLQEMYPELVAASESNKSGESPNECCFEGLRFWYHPDYLGSVDMVTDADGEVHQYFLYNPWGENMYSYTSSNHAFDSEFHFNGKEWDDETGLGYYGARYYEDETSTWLSVDPRAEEFPELSPYSFSADNPVELVDPDGEAPGDPTNPWATSGSVTIGINIGGSRSTMFSGYGKLTLSGGYQASWSWGASTSFVSASVYIGPQMGTSTHPNHKWDVNADFTIGTYVNGGWDGEGIPMNFYTLNYDTKSPFANTFANSVTFGQMLTYNLGLNNHRASSLDQDVGLQFQGLFGFRVGNFMLSTNNDTKTIPYFSGFTLSDYSDAGWTGGLVLSYAMEFPGSNGSISSIDFGHQTFTGGQDGTLSKDGSNKYHQSQYHRSFNKASNFLQFTGPIGNLMTARRIEYYTAGWFQNFIHTYISNQGLFYYDYINKAAASGGAFTN